MARFSAAKNNTSKELSLRNSFNYLIDLLDQRYVLEGTSNNVKVKIEISPTNGIVMYAAGVLVFQIDPTGALALSNSQCSGSDTTHGTPGTDKTITFPITFATAPKVVCQQASLGTSYHLRIGNVTTTGFDIDSDGASVPFHYIAMEA